MVTAESRDPIRRRWDRLIPWLAARGAHIGPLEIRDIGDGERGVFATSPIASGEMILTIPSGCLLPIDGAEASAAADRVAEADGRLESIYSSAAAFLLEQRDRAGSYWEAYIGSLPETCPHSPLFLSEEDRRLLRGTLALQNVDAIQSAVEADHATLCRHIPEFRRFGLEAFAWASFMFCSRVVAIDGEGETIQTMAPLLDMMNHRLPSDVDYRMDGGRLLVTAARDLVAGGEVCLSYGLKGNERLLAIHGFCLEANEHDATEIALPEIPRGHPLAHSAWSLGYPGLDGLRRFRVGLDPGSPASRGMLSFAVMSCASIEEAPALLDAIARHGPDAIGPASAAMRMIAEACRRRLAEFEGGDAPLGGARPGRGARYCLLARDSEMRILRAHLARATSQFQD